MERDAKESERKELILQDFMEERSSRKISSNSIMITIQDKGGCKHGNKVQWGKNSGVWNLNYAHDNLPYSSVDVHAWTYKIKHINKLKIEI